jgi:hypothetical protein
LAKEKIMECPKCHSKGPFFISTSIIIKQYENGAQTADMHSLEYDEDDLCTCDKCDHADDRKFFEVKAT